MKSLTDDPSTHSPNLPFLGFRTLAILELPTNRARLKPTSLSALKNNAKTLIHLGENVQQGVGRGGGDTGNVRCGPGRRPLGRGKGVAVGRESKIHATRGSTMSEKQGKRKQRGRVKSLVLTRFDSSPYHGAHMVSIGSVTHSEPNISYVSNGK